MFDPIDRRLIARLCDDLGETLHPYRDLAAELGISEDDVLRRIDGYKEIGALRRLGAILRHQAAGFTANGMSVWNVPDTDVERVGELMVAYPEISHCYVRNRLPGFPYNLFAMIHGRSEDECKAVAQRLAGEAHLSDYRVLFSVREFKKSSMVYFGEDDATSDATLQNAAG